MPLSWSITQINEFVYHSPPSEPVPLESQKLSFLECLQVRTNPQKKVFCIHSIELTWTTYLEFIGLEHFRRCSCMEFWEIRGSVGALRFADHYVINERLTNRTGKSLDLSSQTNKIDKCACHRNWMCIQQDTILTKCNNQQHCHRPVPGDCGREWVIGLDLLLFLISLDRI